MTEEWNWDDVGADNCFFEGWEAGRVERRGG